MERMAAALARLANEDLTVRVALTGSDSKAQLMDDINGAVGNLATPLTQIEFAAEQVAGAGAAISSSSQAPASSA